jgi:general secretion pathway protein C
MLDSHTNDWLSRLQGNGPRLVSLALAALIAVELARIAISLLSGSPVKSPQPLITGTAPHSQHAQLDIQSVVSAHLFGVATVDPSTQDPANAPQSTANLLLTGTIATSDPKRGVAIISDGGPSKVYSVGDNVGGASLHSVYLDHVILDRSGALETLLLPRLQGPGMHAAAVVRRGGDPRTVAAVENIRRMVQQDPGLLDQVMRTVPSYDSAAGKLRGFRAYPGRNRLIFSKLGLRPGDLVTAINGTALDDPQHSQEVFNTIQTSDHVTVTVERAGQKQEITLNIAQVAAQATGALGLDATGAPSATGETGSSATGSAAPPPVGGAPPPGVPPAGAPPVINPAPDVVPLQPPNPNSTTPNPND